MHPTQFIRNAVYKSIGSLEIFSNRAQWVITIPVPSFLLLWTTEIRVYNKEEALYLVGTLDGATPSHVFDTLPTAPPAAALIELR